MVFYENYQLFDVKGKFDLEDIGKYFKDRLEAKGYRFVPGRINLYYPSNTPPFNILIIGDGHAKILVDALSEEVGLSYKLMDIYEDLSAIRPRVKPARRNLISRKA